MQNSVNIIYVTNQCNLNCDYCYQKDERERLQPETISFEKIKQTLYDVKDSEPIGVSTVVLFGGEAFLYPEKIFYAMNVCKELKTTYNKKIALSTTTNGLWLTHDKNYNAFIDNYKKYINESGNAFSLEISYDVSGNFRRTDKKGSDISHKILKLLQKLKSDNIQITIRYTYNKDTHKTFIRDMIYLLEFYKSKEFLEKIVISFYHQEIEKETGLKSSIIIDSLKEKCKYLYRLYGIPICELACGDCTYCDVGSLNNIKYFDNKSVNTVDKFTEKQFNF